MKRKPLPEFFTAKLPRVRASRKGKGDPGTKPEQDNLLVNPPSRDSAGSSSEGDSGMLGGPGSFWWGKEGKTRIKKSKWGVPDVGQIAVKSSP